MEVLSESPITEVNNEPQDITNEDCSSTTPPVEEDIVHNEENVQLTANTQMDTSTVSSNDTADITTVVGKSRGPQLPLARIKNIMKFDPEVNLIGNDSVYLIAKSTELFIAKLAESAHQFTVQGKRKTVQRRDIDQCVTMYDHFSFLEGILDKQTLS